MVLSSDIETYRIHGIERVRTPALAIYREIVDSNIEVTLRLLGGNPDRWRPHVKTAKLAFIINRMVRRGVASFKCSTSLELLTAIEAGASDVLLAYPAVGANALRVRELAHEFPRVRVSALIEDSQQLTPWLESNVGLFIDVNPGMNRTGIEQDRSDDIVRLARAVQNAGLALRGLHYYDGHISSMELPERTAVAHRGYDRLMSIVDSLTRDSVEVGEVITAGTPAFPCTISYGGFRSAPFVHRASPGTVIYGDCSSLAQLPSDFGYRPAAVVVSTVVSRPLQGRVTCDAGHKTVSADAGLPTCAVIGRPDLAPVKPSEEHLPIETALGSSPLQIGEVLYLVPRHVCPTVNNFDHALIVAGGEIASVEPVTARGRETPIDIRSGD